MTSNQNPPVLRAAEVPVPPDRAFAAFTDEIGAWWPYRSHGVFGSQAGGVRFVDGRLVELAVDGEEATWAEVTTWEPPKGFTLSWHPGRPEGPASRVEVTFEPLDDGSATRVEIRHDGWEAFGADAIAYRRSYAGPSAWGSLLDHFSDLVEPQVDAVDTSDLGAAYEKFFATAEGDGFGPAPEGQWSAPEVLAHVALNDLAMVAVAQCLIDREEPTFRNGVSQDRANLARVIEQCGDMAGLIDFGRSCAAQAKAVVGRLDAEQQATMVHCVLEHDGAVVLDDARPWAALAVKVQAEMHLPAHIGQLEDLRL